MAEQSVRIAYSSLQLEYRIKVEMEKDDVDSIEVVKDQNWKEIVSHIRALSSSKWGSLKAFKIGKWNNLISF